MRRKQVDRRQWMVVHARCVLGPFASMEVARAWRNRYCGRVKLPDGSTRLATVLPVLEVETRHL